MSQQGTAAVPTFGQQIENDLKTAWADAEAFGEAALKEGGAIATNEEAALQNAATGLLSNFVPAQVALVEGWVKEVVSDLGAGVGIDAAVTGVLNKDAAAGEKSFLAGEKTTAIAALTGSFLSAL